MVAVSSCTKYEEEAVKSEPKPEPRSDEYFETRALPSPNNPYSLSNMQEALNQLAVETGMRIPPLSPTHRYVKFNLRDTAAYSLLCDSLNLSLYKYPLDYRLEEGEMEYYLGKRSDWYYCVIPADFPADMGIPCELLDNLYMQKANSTRSAASPASVPLLNENMYEEALKRSMTNNGYTVHDGAASAA